MSDDSPTWRRRVWTGRVSQGSLPVSDFGAEMNLYEQIQSKLNSLGMTSPLTVDGNFGPKSEAALLQFQKTHNLNPTGKVDPASLNALGLGNLVTQWNATPNVATVVAALTQASKEMGFTLSSQLAVLMIGQLRGAEGTMPGLGGTLGGTNNYGAAQVTKGLAQAKAGQVGWGAFAHKDSDPNTGAYVGWYWIAPSPLEGARYWLSNWWGKALLQGNPQTPQDYASILYKGRYFAGMHAGDSQHDPTSPAGAQNVADYAAGIRRGIASSAEMAEAPKDPAALTVDPSSFASLTARGVTQDMFDAGKSGAWSWLLPSSWSNLLSNNGAIFFGPPPTGGWGSALGNAAKGAAIALPILLGGAGLLALILSQSKASKSLDRELGV
jgi:hypothetical protein